MDKARMDKARVAKLVERLKAGTRDTPGGGILDGRALGRLWAERVASAAELELMASMAAGREWGDLMYDIEGEQPASMMVPFVALVATGKHEFFADFSEGVVEVWNAVCDEVAVPADEAAELRRKLDRLDAAFEEGDVTQAFANPALDAAR